MDIIPKNPILEFNPDTLQCLRTLYGLEKQGKMNNAIDVLSEWLKNQKNFVQKEFSREYLERTIILSKGSVERAKVKLEKTCMHKTKLPNYFEPFDARNSQLLDIVKCSLLPKMTDDHYRVFVLKNVGQRFDTGFFEFYRYAIMICEYLQANDYCNGIIGIFDYFDANLIEVVKSTSLVELRQAMLIAMEGYGMRFKSMHFITKSKAIHALLMIVKKTISSKVVQRIYVHKDIETLYCHVPREILPLDYGGEGDTINKYSDNLKQELSSKESMEYFNKIKQFRSDVANEKQYESEEKNMAITKSFKNLDID